MEFTGERYIPGKSHSFLEADHLKRYFFAKDYVFGVVLDIGCGSGKGTYMLSQQARVYKCIGIDVSEEAILYAKDHFANQNVEFAHMDATNLFLFENGYFDSIVAFEVIEHIKNYKKMLDEIKRVLKPSGCCLITTPNRRGEHSGNPYHHSEFSHAEFGELLKGYFSHLEIFGLYREVSRRYKLIRWMDVFNLRRFIPQVIRRPITLSILGTTPFDATTIKDIRISEHMRDISRTHVLVAICS